MSARPFVKFGVWPHSCGGLGDAIRESRFLPRFTAAYPDVTVVTRPELGRLFAPLGPQVCAIPWWQPYAGAYVRHPPGWVPWGAGVPGTEAAHILMPARPGTVWPEPVVDPRRLCPGPLPPPGPLWADDTVRGPPPDGRVRVGLCSQASGPDKCVPRALLPPLLAGHPAVQWVSLTVGDEFAPRDLADTAGVVETCDLVVTADTAVAHLAASLGRPTWVLVAAPGGPSGGHEHWRQLMAEGWYARVRPFWQEQLGVWAPVLAEVAAALRELA